MQTTGNHNTFNWRDYGGAIIVAQSQKGEISSDTVAQIITDNARKLRDRYRRHFIDRTYTPTDWSKE